MVQFTQISGKTIMLQVVHIMYSPPHVHTHTTTTEATHLGLNQPPVSSI